MKYWRWLALAGLLLAGCSTGIAGQAQAAPYVSLDPATVALEPISADIDTQVLALSPDGTTVIVENGQFGLCAVPIATDRVTDDDFCSGTDNDAPQHISYVEFSPDGTRAVARQDLIREVEGGAWIFDVSTGTAIPIALPDVSEFSGQQPGIFSGYLDLTWGRQQGDLIGLSLASYDTRTARALVRIDPTTGVSQAIGDSLSTKDGAPRTLVAASGKAVYSLSLPDETGSHVWCVDLTTGEAREMNALAPDGTDMAPVNFPLDISPDGTRALIRRVDPFSFAGVAVVEVDLATGALTQWPDSPGFEVYTAAYSPDGQQVMVVGKPSDAATFNLLLYSAQGKPLADLGNVETSVYAESRLRWTAGDILTVARAATVGRGEPVGWRIIG